MCLTKSLGRKNEFVVDNVRSPTMVYGIADGKGDFVRQVSIQQVERLKNLKDSINALE